MKLKLLERIETWALAKLQRAGLTKERQIALTRKGGTLDQWTRALLVCLGLTVALFAAPANAVIDGATVWAQIKTIVFGPWGLLVGFIICVIALCGIPKWGIGWAFGITAAAVVFFCIPGFLTMFQTTAQSIS